MDYTDYFSISTLYELQRYAQRTLSSEFVKLSQTDSLPSIVSTIGLAFAFGAIHALTPGHGKVFLASYLLNQGGGVFRVLGVTIRTVLTHVIGAVLLVTGAVWVFDVGLGMRPADYPLIHVLSYALITIVGAVMLIDAIGFLRGIPLARIKRSNAAIPYLAGLTPCPLTTIVMIAATARDMILTGFLIVSALASGMVVTIAIVASLAVLFRSAFIRLLRDNETTLLRIVAGFQIAGAVALTALGGHYVLKCNAVGVIHI